MAVRTLTGPGLFEELGAALDEIHTATGTPITARRPWLETWVRSFNGYEPFAVVVDGPGGCLEAAALLAQSGFPGLRQVTAIGDGPSDHLSLPARHPAAARTLARAVADYLEHDLRGQWFLIIRQLTPGDPVAAALAAELPWARILPGQSSPLTRFEERRSIDAHLSRDQRRAVRRRIRRMTAEGLSPEISHLRDPEAVATILPEVEAVCRSRDSDMGRAYLEDKRKAEFFRAAINRHASRGEAELTTLRVRGQLAAYAVCLLDGETRRLWNGRFAPEWRRFGPGQIANSAALERALTDPSCTQFDWMRGDHPYKLSMANGSTQAEMLLAASSPLIGHALALLRQLKRAAKDWRARHA